MNFQEWFQKTALQEPYVNRGISMEDAFYGGIAAHNAKLLAGVEMPEVTRFDIDMDGSMEPHEDGAWVRAEVFFDRLQQYAAACAAQARVKALDEAKRVCERAGEPGLGSKYQGDVFAAAIELLKGGE